VTASSPKRLGAVFYFNQRRIVMAGKKHGFMVKGVSEKGGKKKSHKRGRKKGGKKGHK